MLVPIMYLRRQTHGTLVCLALGLPQGLTVVAAISHHALCARESRTSGDKLSSKRNCPPETVLFNRNFLVHQIFSLMTNSTKE